MKKPFKALLSLLPFIFLPPLPLAAVSCINDSAKSNEFKFDDSLKAKKPSEIKIGDFTIPTGATDIKLEANDKNGTLTITYKLNNETKTHVITGFIKDDDKIEKKMKITIGSKTFSATLENNSSAQTLVELLKKGPLIIQKQDYGGFEKVGPLGVNLPRNDKQMNVGAGEIILYTGNQNVLYYGTNSWSFTKLGKVDNLTGWREALGNGNVSVTFSL